jgi:endo-1,4-beta-xylanase
MVEPEDAMKWWVIRHNPDSFDFREADEVVAFARARKMKVRGHCLVWDHNHPDWLAHPRGRALWFDKTYQSKPA